MESGTGKVERVTPRQKEGITEGLPRSHDHRQTKLGLEYVEKYCRQTHGQTRGSDVTHDHAVAIPFRDSQKDPWIETTTRLSTQNGVEPTLTQISSHAATAQAE